MVTHATRTDVVKIELINDEGVLIEHGSIVHACSGPYVGRAYRYEGVFLYGHHTYRVKVSRKSTLGHFRAVAWAHPSVFGCTVRVPLTRRQACRAKIATLWAKIDDWFWAGTFALIPLAVFEHYHLATKITEVISLGMIGGDVSAGH